MRAFKRLWFWWLHQYDNESEGQYLFWSLLTVVIGLVALVLAVNGISIRLGG